jgi:hypothetical protein
MLATTTLTQLKYVQQFIAVHSSDFVRLIISC